MVQPATAQIGRISVAGIVFLVFLEYPQEMGYGSSCVQRSGEEARG
jgi:hypothetical protein